MGSLALRDQGIVSGEHKPEFKGYIFHIQLGYNMAMAIIVYCLRMCMLDNKLQTFFNLVLFQQLCGPEVLWNWFSFCCM